MSADITAAQANAFLAAHTGPFTLTGEQVSIVEAAAEIERKANLFAATVHAHLLPGFRAIARALSAPLNPKAARRIRRAQLRRVHRDYVQRNRRRPVDLLFCAFDETHRFHPDTQEAR